MVAAVSGPFVILHSTDGKQSIRLELGQDRFPRSIAWHPGRGNSRSALTLTR